MFLAYIFRNTHHAENIRLAGGKVDQEALAAAVGKRDWEAAKKFISDEVVHAHSIAWNSQRMPQSVGVVYQGRAQLAGLLPMGTQEARKKVIRMVKELGG